MSEISLFHNSQINTVASASQVPRTAGAFTQQLNEYIAQTPPDSQNWKSVTQILSGTKYIANEQLTTEGRQAVLSQQQQLQNEYDIEIPIELAAKKMLLDLLNSPVAGVNRTEAELQLVLSAHGDYQNALAQHRNEYQEVSQIKSLQEQLRTQLNQLGLSQAQFDAIQYGNQQAITLGELSAGMDSPTERLVFQTNMASQLLTQQQADTQTAARQAQLDTLNASISAEQQSLWETQLQPTGHDLESIINSLETPALETLTAKVNQIVNEYFQKQVADTATIQTFLSELSPAQRASWETSLGNIDVDFDRFLLQYLATRQTLNTTEVKAAVDALPAVQPVTIEEPTKLARNEQYAIANKNSPLNTLVDTFSEDGFSSAYHVRFQNSQGDHITGFQVYWHGDTPNSGTLFLTPQGDALPAVEQPVAVFKSSLLPELVRLQDGTEISLQELLQKTDELTGEKQVTKVLVSNGGSEFYELPSNGRVANILEALNGAESISDFSALWPEPFTPSELRSSVGGAYQQLWQKTHTTALAHVDREFENANSFEALEISKNNLLQEYWSDHPTEDLWRGYPEELQTDIKNNIYTKFDQRQRELLLSGAVVDREIKLMDLSHTDLRGLDFSGVSFSAVRFGYANLEGQNLRGVNITAGYHDIADGVNLKNANLESSQLVNISMRGAQLEGANLRRSNLRGLVVLNADFSGADFSGATVKNIDFSHAKVNALKYDQNTRWDAVRFTYEQLQVIGLDVDIPDYLKEVPSSEASFVISGTQDNLQLNRSWISTQQKVQPNDMKLWPNSGNKSMQNLDFSEGDFSGVNFNFFILSNSNFKNGAFRQTNFQTALMDGSNFENADLLSAVLNHADLRQSNLRGAQLQDASLIYSQLQGADMQGAQLVDSKMSGARMNGANLMDANLQGAHLRRVDLRGVNATGANFTGANLSAVDLRQTDLSHIQHDSTTVWAEAELTPEQIEHLGLSSEQLAASPETASSQSSGIIGIGDAPPAPTDSNTPSSLQNGPQNSLGGFTISNTLNPFNNPNGIIGNNGSQAGHGDGNNNNGTITAVAGDPQEPNNPFQVINGQVVVGDKVLLPELDLSGGAAQPGETVFGIPVGLNGLPENITQAQTQSNTPVADTHPQSPRPTNQQQGGVTIGGQLGSPGEAEKANTEMEQLLGKSSRQGVRPDLFPTPIDNRIPGFGEGVPPADASSNDTSWGLPDDPVTLSESEGFPEKDPVLDQILNPNGVGRPQFTFPPIKEGSRIPEVPAEAQAALTQALPELQGIRYAQFSQLSTADQQQIIPRTLAYQQLAPNDKTNISLIDYLDSSKTSEPQRQQLSRVDAAQTVHQAQLNTLEARTGLNSSTIDLINARINALQANTAQINQQTQSIQQSNAQRINALATQAQTDPLGAAFIKPEAPQSTPENRPQINAPVSENSAPIPRFMVVRTENGPKLIENLANGQSQLHAYPLSADTPITRQETNGAWSGVPDVGQLGSKLLLDLLFTNGALKMLNNGNPVQAPNSGTPQQPPVNSTPQTPTGIPQPGF